MTLYPDFAIPHKHYTRQTIMGYAGAYLEPETTYQMAAMHDHGVPGYPHGDATLAPSSIHRVDYQPGGLCEHMPHSPFAAGSGKSGVPHMPGSGPVASSKTKVSVRTSETTIDPLPAPVGD